MPVTDDEKRQYFEFVLACARELGCVPVDPGIVLWHYTTGPGLLGILDSGTLYATQVACLNDSTEIRYASKLFQDALAKLKLQRGNDATAIAIIQASLSYFKEQPDFPAHAPLPYFVACFSENGDDLVQWRSYCNGENGYAIGFSALAGC